MADDTTTGEVAEDETEEVTDEVTDEVADETTEESDDTITLASVQTEIAEMVTEYGVDVAVLSISLAIELFKDLRNYPATWTDDQIAADLAKNENKIAMAAVEIDAKNGIEGQNYHNEGGYTRQYTERLLAYKDVIGFAVCG